MRKVVLFDDTNIEENEIDADADLDSMLIEQETNIVTVGSVDSGKSTFIGTLVTNELDDGNYKLSKIVAKHKHEVETKKTSDISVKTVRRYKGKDVVLIDLCGHKKYLKTTIFGLTGYFPDYGVLILAANKGELPPMTKEHIDLLLCLGIPFAVMITREDIAPVGIYSRSLKNLKKYLAEKQVKVMYVNKSMKMYLLEKRDAIITEVERLYNVGEFASPLEVLKKRVNDHLDDIETINYVYSGLSDTRYNLPKDDIEKLGKVFANVAKEYELSTRDSIIAKADSMKTNRYLVPAITISNKTGYFLETAKEFIYNLKPRKDHWLDDEDTVFYIDSSFEKPGIGIIVSGILRGGKIYKGEEMYLGPYGTEFIKVKIWTIHDNRSRLVDELSNKHRGCFAIRVLDKKIDFKRKNINKGMVIIRSFETAKHLCYEFTAKVMILNHSTTIKTGYSPSLQITNSKQCARITLPLNDEQKDENGNVIQPTLRTGSEAEVKFRFLYRAEFIRPGDEFVFKEETTRGQGTVISILPLKEDKRGPAGSVKKTKNRYKVASQKGVLSVK